MKKTFYTEIAYLLGVLTMALGTALIERANFGVAMVVAPAYLLYLKFSQIWSFVTFGMMEYTLQAIILIGMSCVMRKFKWSYLFSFVTAVVYGCALDLFMGLVAALGAPSMALRITFYGAGLLLCAGGVACMFHTYISPEAYELAVKEITAHFHLDITKFKTIYDCSSCLVAIGLSFLFFGLWHFEGVKIGTFICAINGVLIGLFSKYMDRHFTFRDGLPLRRFFC